MTASFPVRTIEQEVLEQLLERVKNPVDKDTHNDNRQYDGENHLVGIEFFHKKYGLIFIRVHGMCFPVSTY